MLDSFYLDPNAVTGPDPLGILMVAVIAYFCGCFNGAVIVSKYILRDDVRNHGSGNAGLTNFYRTFGGPLTFVVILCDVLKAVVAVLLGSWLLGSAFGKTVMRTVLRSAVCGHFSANTGLPCSVCWVTCSPACSTSRAARASSPAAPSSG